jgi:histone H3/H4
LAEEFTLAPMRRLFLKQGAKEAVALAVGEGRKTVLGRDVRAAKRQFDAVMAGCD